MDVFDLLNQSEVGKEYAYQLNLSVNIYGQNFYPWVSRINKLLNYQSPEQREILKNKFKNFKDAEQLLDRLAEIIVATHFMEELPIFYNDIEGKPDIFLKESKNYKYIEVKRINISDEEKELIKQLTTNKEIVARDLSSKLFTQEQQKNSLLKKTQEQIQKALIQLNRNLKEGEKGLIVIVYKLDQTGYIGPLYIRKKEFENMVLYFFNNINKHKNVDIKIKDEDILYYN